jgi:hypothetical protein
MPELDFMVVADYVRQDGGVLQMVGAGFDTMFVPALPAAHQIGIGLRLQLDVAEAQEQHRVDLIYQDADGQRLAHVAGTVGPVPEDQPLPPPGRPFGVLLAFNLALPVPAYGDFSLELFVDDNEEPVKSITLTAADPRSLPGAPGHA